MKNLLLKIIFSAPIFLGFGFLLISSASAARLYFVPSKGDFSSDATLIVDLKIDTEGQSINTIEGYLRFSKDIFALEKISDGSSIISFWVKKPEDGAGNIAFAGVIPGGYLGQDGLLMRIFLKPKKEGYGTLEAEPNSKVFLNDGLGTEAGLKFTATSFNIIEPGAAVPIVPKTPKPPTIIVDTEAPEAFSPQIARDPNIFDGKWFFVFATQDKNSGIDRYEIQETKGKQPISDNWTAAESPYRLTDQKLYSYIFVKAVDKTGNERIAMLAPTFAPWYKKPIVNIIVGTSILIVVLLVRWLWKLLRQKKRL